ncbi:MAG: Hpt domain-containing protein, partial [Nitrospira sp.]|nr:Hpt domain-containing protein [Nitrospira sp.]
MSDESKPDPSLLGLFKIEVEGQAEVINNHLLAIEGGEKADGERLESLMRAAHSIKGAARLSDLHSAAKLAHTMEDVFVALQQGKLAVSPGVTDALLGGAAFYDELSRLEAEEIYDWLQERADAVTELIAKVESAGQGSPAEATAAEPEGDQASAAAGADAIEAPAPEMMDLFRIEVENQNTVVEKGLFEIEKNEAGADTLERLMRSAHSIKGAAKMVDIPSAGELAHAMEDAFVAMQKGSLKAGQELLDLFFAAAGYLGKLSTIDAADTPAWVAANRGEAERVATGLRRAAGEGKPAPDAQPFDDDAAGAIDASPRAVSGIDPSMMELARQEIDSNLKALDIDFEGLAVTRLEPVIRAFHSLKGTMRIIDQSPMVEVAGAAESRLRDISSGAGGIDAGLAEAFSDAVGIFAEIAEVPDADIEGWVATNSDRCDELKQRVLSTETVAPGGQKKSGGKKKPSKKRKAAMESATSTADSMYETADPRGTGTGTGTAWGRRAVDKDRERWLRVTSEHLDSLMALSGES